MRIGIVGTGYIASLHSKTYKDLGVEIGAVCDVDADKYEKHKDLYGNAAFYNSVDAFLNEAAVDAVDICVPNNVHFEMVKRVRETNRHIFCEKTLTDSEANSADLVRLLADYDKNFQIGYMKRFFPATTKVVELIPMIGDVFGAYIRSYQGFDWTYDIYKNEAWRPKDGRQSSVRQCYSGGMLNMAGSHMLDLMLLFLGRPRKVTAQNWSPRDYDAEMNANAMFLMENSAIVHFEACASPYSRGGLRQDGWDEVIQINGTRGRIEVSYVIWDAPMNNAPLVRYYSEDTKTLTEFTFQKVNPFNLELGAFVSNCREGIRSTPGVVDGYLVDRLISACYESAENGTTIDLKWLP